MSPSPAKPAGQLSSFICQLFTWSDNRDGAYNFKRLFDLRQQGDSNDSQHKYLQKVSISKYTKIKKICLKICKQTLF